MFPALSDQDCEAEPEVHEGAFKCAFDYEGEEGYFRYSIWDDEENAYNNYNDEFGTRPAAWKVDGEKIGYKWRVQNPRNNLNYKYKAARVYSDVALSFTVYANTQDAIQHALDDVIVTRPPWELRGVENG